MSWTPYPLSCALREPALTRPVTSKPPSSYHHGNLRQALIDATVVLVTEGGADNVTLRGAARLAGVSRTAPYRHFKDKRALLAGLAAEGFRAFEIVLSEASRRHEDPGAKLQALGAAYVGFAVDRPAHFRVMFGAELGDKRKYPELMQAANHAFTHLLDAVESCRRAGMLRDVPAEELTLLAWSSLHGLANLVLDGQLRALGLEGHPPDSLATNLSAHLMAGLLA